MAKVKPASPGQGITPRSKGDFIVLATKHGWIAQKWPRKRGPAKTPYQRWRQKEFGLAAAMASNPLDLDYGTALEMVKGTTYVPRDFLMMCSYGNAYVLKNEDGTIWPRYTEVTNNPQYMLEQITSTPGSMIYRGEELWTWIGPSSNGFMLTMQDGLPVWKAPPTPPANTVLTTVLRRTTDDAMASAAQHDCTFQEAVIDELGLWDPTNPDRLTFPTNVHRMRLTAMVYGLTPSSSILQTARTTDDAGNVQWLGGAANQMRSTLTTAQFAYMSLIGPWVPQPATPYCKLNVNHSTSSTWTFRAQTTLTIEAILQD